MRSLVATLSITWLTAACGGSVQRPAVATPEPEPASLEPAERPSRETIEAWIESVELRVDRPTELPSIPADHTRRGDTLATWTSADERSVIVREPHGVVVRASLAGPDAPAGVRARLVPVLHGGIWPHFALLIDGWDVAVPLSSHGPGALPFRPPLRRAPGATAARAALEATARLRHGSDCGSEPDEDAGCFYYGSEGDLGSVRDGDVAGGWLLFSETPRSPSPGAVWSDVETYGREPALSIQTAERPDYEGGVVTRFSLRRGGRLTHAFDLATESGIDEHEWHGGRVIAMDGVLLVWVSVGGWQHSVSRHDPESGARIGEPMTLGVAPHVGEAHGAPPDLALVLDASQLRFALHLTPDDALLFDRPDEPGRFVPLLPREDDPQEDEEGDDEGPAHWRVLRLERCGETPCLRARGAAPSASMRPAASQRLPRPAPAPVP